MQTRRPHAFLLSLLLGAMSCEESELTTMCRSICQNLGCGDADVTTCRKDCVARMDEAEESSDDCAKNYQAMLVCLEDVFCAEIGTWEVYRATDNEYDCRPETESFIAACPSLWFGSEGK